MAADRGIPAAPDWRILTMRLLLAEDERSLSKALVTLLEHDKYEVQPAYDGEEALESLRSGNFDAAVLDIMMPKMDGLTVLKEIRKDGNPIPILLLTAKGEVEDRVIGLDSGANDYLPKPFNFKELTARIRAMTRTPGRGKQPPGVRGRHAGPHVVRAQHADRLHVPR